MQIEVIFLFIILIKLKIFNLGKSNMKVIEKHFKYGINCLHISLVNKTNTCFTYLQNNPKDNTDKIYSSTVSVW